MRCAARLNCSIRPPWSMTMIASTAASSRERNASPAEAACGGSLPGLAAGSFAWTSGNLAVVLDESANPKRMCAAGLGIAGNRARQRCESRPSGPRPTMSLWAAGGPAGRVAALAQGLPEEGAMRLMRWEPFREMDDLLQGFGPLFGRVPALARTAEGVTEFMPAADIVEREKEYLIK